MIKVSVKDFGPIIEGTVDLKPLTIFVGPSNSGKSYMAMMVYSLMKTFSPAHVFPVAFHPAGSGRTRRQVVRGQLPWSELTIESGVQDAFNEWLGGLDLHSEVDLGSLPPEVRDLANRLTHDAIGGLGPVFNNELLRCHGPINRLVRNEATADRLRVSLEQDESRLAVDFASDSSSSNVEMSKRAIDISGVKFEDSYQSIMRTIRSIALTGIRSGPDRDPFYFDLILMMLDSAARRLFENFPSDCFYLPAARSGIAQGHKVMASMLVRQSSLAGIQPLAVPTLSGIVTDFMGSLLTMERGGRQPLDLSSELDDAVRFLEQKVVQGEVGLEQTSEAPYPEIYYEPLTGIGRLPFHRTSSMVSELAPVILFLKHLVASGDLVILEEPESHLHPAAQRQMARAIVRLVNAGIQVLITTHSDFFLGQINNLLRLSYASKRWIREHDFDVHDSLNHDSVGAYHFDISPDGSGSMIRPLEVRDDLGIDDEMFGEVVRSFYDESILVQNLRIPPKVTPSSYLVAIRDRHIDCCITNQCEDQGCELRLDEIAVSGLTIIHGSRYQSAHGYSDRLCDRLIFGNMTHSFVCATELKGGANLDPDLAVEQIQNGLTIAEEHLEGFEIASWRPLLVFDREGLRWPQVRVLDQMNVTFRGEKKRVEMNDCGSRLIDILARAV